MTLYYAWYRFVRDGAYFRRGYWILQALPDLTAPGNAKKTKNETNEREMEEREGKGSADGGSGGVRATRYVMLDVLAS